MEAEKRVIGIVSTPLGTVVVSYENDDEGERGKVLVTFEADGEVRTKALVSNDKKPAIEVTKLKEC